MFIRKFSFIYMFFKCLIVFKSKHLSYFVP